MTPAPSPRPLDLYVACNGCDRLLPDREAFAVPVEHGWLMLCRSCWAKHLFDLAAAMSRKIPEQLAANRQRREDK